MITLESKILEIVRVLSTTKDVGLVGEILKLIERKGTSDIVGFRPNGQPISRQDLAESLEQSEKDAENGNTFSGKELIEHFRTKAQNG